MREYGTLGGAVKDRPEDEEEFYRGVMPEETPREIVYETPERETPQHDAFAYARETVDATIAQSDYFIETAHEREIDPTSTHTMEYKHLLASITNEYLSDPDTAAYFTEIDGGETYQAIKLLGTAPYAVSVQQHAERSQDPMSERNKQTLIDFNHTYLDLIEANPANTPTGIAEKVDEFVATYDTTLRGYTHNTLLDIGYGMRTEYAFLTAVNDSSTAHARRATADEDKHGVDAVVSLPGAKEELGVDVKSSQTGVDEKTTHDDDSITYLLKTSDEDFNHDSFTLMTTSRIRLRRKILEDLQMVVQAREKFDL